MSEARSDEAVCEHPEREHEMSLHSEPVKGGMRYENKERVYCARCHTPLGQRTIR